MFSVLVSDECVVHWFYNNMEVEGAIEQVFRRVLVQVRLSQEVHVLLRALVKVVDVFHHQLPLLPGHHQHRLLKGHSSRVGAGRGRGDDDTRSPTLLPTGLHGPYLHVRWLHADWLPAWREPGVPRHPLIAVVAAGTQLSLEAGAAIVSARTADGPR